MYLSSLELNLRSHRVHKELTNRYELHRTIMHAFKPTTPDNERVLFRVELLENRVRVLVQTQNLPSWSFLEEDPNFTGYLAPQIPTPQIKNLSPHFQSGQKFYFRLHANPTARKATFKDENGHGKRIGLYSQEDQVKWLTEKCQTGGFEVLDMTLIPVNVIHGLQPDTKTKKNPLQILCIQYEGVLTIKDPERFEKTLNLGIGPAKSFGCGLLSLARL